MNIEQPHQKIRYWDKTENFEYDADTVKTEHLGNFCARLPGGNSREEEVEEIKTYREIVGEDSTYSALLLDQTEKQFYEAIDNAIQEAQVPQELVNKLYTFSPSRGATDQLTSALEQHVLNVYEILRKRGYYQKDLAI